MGSSEVSGLEHLPRCGPPDPSTSDVIVWKNALPPGPERVPASAVPSRHWDRRAAAPRPKRVRTTSASRPEAQIVCCSVEGTVALVRFQGAPGWVCGSSGSPAGASRPTRARAISRPGCSTKSAPRRHRLRTGGRPGHTAPAQAPGPPLVGTPFRSFRPAIELTVLTARCGSASPLLIAGAYAERRPPPARHRSILSLPCANRERHLSEPSQMSIRLRNASRVALVGRGSAADRTRPRSGPTRPEGQSHVFISTAARPTSRSASRSSWGAEGWNGGLGARSSSCALNDTLGALISFGSANHNDDPRGRAREHSAYRLSRCRRWSGWITPWRSSAAVSSGDGEVMAACTPAMSGISAVVATLLLPSAAT